jgi:hypothetical protein
MAPAPSRAAASHRRAAVAAAMARFHGARAAASARISARSSARLNSPDGQGGGISAGGMRFSRAASSGGSRSMQRTASSNT